MLDNGDTVFYKELNNQCSMTELTLIEPISVYSVERKDGTEFYISREYCKYSDETISLIPYSKITSIHTLSKKYHRFYHSSILEFKLSNLKENTSGLTESEIEDRVSILSLEFKSINNIDNYENEKKSLDKIERTLH